MRNMFWKILLIVVVLGFCGAGLYFKNIRLGKDLRGGVSLIYAVNMPEEGDSGEILTQVINVLKDRVNPTGVLDISMQPLGNDRIEVVMPLPDEQVKQLRDEFEAALEQVLADAQIDGNELDRSIRSQTAVERYCTDEASQRCQQVRELQQVWNTIAEKEQALEQARANDAEQQRILTLERELAQADVEYEQIRREILRQSLDEGRVRRMLKLDDTPRVEKDNAGEPVIDEQTGEKVMLPSMRAEAVEQLKSEYPELAQEIDLLVERWDAYDSQRIGLDDPEDLKRLMRGAGVLEFRISVPNTGAEGVDVQSMRQELGEVGPENTTSPVARWFEIQDLQQWYDTPEQLAALEQDPAGYFAARPGNFVVERVDGAYYMLLYDTEARAMTHGGDRSWSIEWARRDVDQLGRPAVSFRLDTYGGQLMSRLTGPNVGSPMAIVLDGKVYSAPTLQGNISNRGQITGSFSEADISYLIRVLAAGALEARLSPEPIAEITLGPSLGRDNLERGKEAFIIAIIVVAIFMLIYYFFAGFVAVLALAANALIIFGFMAWIDGTFTLPGLAGVVLTIGMAVDANVLIYERIREELFAGEFDLRGSIRQGYAKALSTIFDANITNLIVCFVLAKTATTEVKGFATTLAIGICATLFTALFMTRQIFILATELGGMRRLHMLPTVVPAIHRALEPKIRWTKLAPVLMVFSGVVVVISIVLVANRGADMLDTELRGGVSATMNTAVIEEPGGEEPQQRLLLEQISVEQRVHALAEAEGMVDDIDADPELVRKVQQEFTNASVLTIGETQLNEQGNVVADAFQVKVSSPTGIDEDTDITNVVVELLIEEFGDQLDVAPPLDFEGANVDNAAPYVYAIEDDNLGKAIGNPSFNVRVPDYRGGVAVVVRDVSPATTVDDVERRIENMRVQPDFEDVTGREFAVFGMTPAGDGDASETFTDFVVVVSDSALSSLRVDSDVWYERLASREWELISTALSQPTSLDQVSSFSSAVAQTLKAQATVAVFLTLLGILAYIWARFGSLRYSMAAVAALAHDVCIAMGLLALTAFIGNTVFGQALLIEEFRIDLGVVAALLTIIGYSLNDTIVILDRIRENRGKRPLATPEIVNTSINQTVSRTVLTSGTTVAAVAIMYFEGGSGIRPFAFTLLIGLLVGTYSSVAIAAPLVVGRGGGGAAPQRAPEPATETEGPTATPA